MAGFTFYDTYFVMLLSMLESLEAILTKAETHAKENNIDVDAEYAPARLYEDMHPLTYQVQVVSNAVKGFAEKVLGLDVPVWADDETTFEQLFARIKKTQELVKDIKPEDVNGKENKEFEGKAGPLVYKTTGSSYTSTFIIPNAYFHLQTAYAILRMKGVPVGKRDYLAAFMTKDPGQPFGKQ